MIEVVSIGLSLALTGIGILLMLFSGIRNLMHGKSDLKKIGSLAVPFAVFGISWVVTGGATEAGIATMIFMLAVLVLFILYTGLRSTFKF